jgi:hypothetical protein
LSSLAYYRGPGWMMPGFGDGPGHREISGWMMRGYAHHGHGYAVPGSMMGYHGVGYDGGPSTAAMLGMMGLVLLLVVTVVAAVALLIRRQSKAPPPPTAVPDGTR